jgi:hypothetical protein
VHVILKKSMATCSAAARKKTTTYYTENSMQFQEGEKQL